MGNKNLVPLNDGRGAEFMSEEAQSQRHLVLVSDSVAGIWYWEGMTETTRDRNTVFKMLKRNLKKYFI